MEISTRSSADGLELAVTGRLDAYWADHLSKALEEAVRSGAHRIRVDLAGVAYMSSVGIRVLLKFYKELQRLKGSFAVVRPSDAVRTVLELAGLDVLLETVAPVPGVGATATSRVVERETATWEVFEATGVAPLRCRAVGRPDLLDGCRFDAGHATKVRFGDETFGLGLGGFGESFEDCRGRFGEFVAVAGAAAYLPTDGTNVPDEFVSSKALVPEVNVLYALVCEGRPSRLVRFDAKPTEEVALSELVEVSLELANADAAGIVVVAEAAGLLGAALRRSPAGAGAAGPSAPFAFPQVREWLSFTPERTHARSLAVLVGVATRTACPGLAPLVRPLGRAPLPAAHFHAAAFSYRALPKGPIEMTPTVQGLFAAETLQGVLHLLHDDREIVGAGESAFVRGACWLAPIGEVLDETHGEARREGEA